VAPGLFCRIGLWEIAGHLLIRFAVEKEYAGAVSRNTTTTSRSAAANLLRLTKQQHSTSENCEHAKERQVSCQSQGSEGKGSERQGFESQGFKSEQ
jgi:hypothetical protein